MTRSRLATAGFLIAWATAGTVVGAGLMRSHWVPLVVPPADAPAAGDSRREVGEWLALHVLAADCGCSRRVLAHLNRRGPEPGVRERILWVGSASHPPAVSPGFEVECLTAETLAAEHRIEAVPVLVVVGPDGTVRYRGGYTARKQGYDIRDRQIVAAVRRGEPALPLPVYGCPSSARAKAAASPFPDWTRGDVP